MKLSKGVLVKRAWPESQPMLVPWYFWDDALKLGYITDDPKRFRRIPPAVGG